MHSGSKFYVNLIQFMAQHKLEIRSMNEIDKYLENINATNDGFVYNIS